ncbi:MAG TPA: ATP-binding protein [Chloroflexota bacterium]|jgi:hypothetical protein
MSPADRFPRELLTAPAAARLAYFASKVVAHPRLKAAHQALEDALHQPAGASLILVYGPTGVGKTTLRRRIEQQLLAAALPELERDPGRLPVLALEAVAPESGQFNWKDYYTRALVALEEPLLAHKIAPAAGSPAPDGTARPVIKRGTSAPELRWVLEQSLRQRGVAVCLVDEAQHLRRLASARRLLDQMDTLKSLAALTGTVHVLVGTYELLGLANLSAQLSRRSVEIHFGRYHADRAADRLAFQSVVLTFQRHLPLAEEPDLVGAWEALYEGSLGCVGVLKSWLDRALADALAEGAPTLTPRHLARQAAPTRTLLSLARELAEGEQALREEARARDHLRTLLGLAPGATASALPSANGTGSPPPTGTPRPHPPGRAAQRRPMRDPVGKGRHEHEP